MSIDWKKVTGLVAVAAMLTPLAACGSNSSSESSASSEGGEVTLSVWAPQEDQAKENGDWLGTMEKAFEEKYPEYKITWKNDVVSEGDASKTVAQDPSAAADVYMFANDQLGVLLDNNAIGQLSDDAAKQVKDQNEQSLVDSVTGQDGNLYGVPYTGNTWFMYYNKSKYSEEDVKSFDTLLEKGKVSFPITNSWYLPAFYVGGGMTLFGEKGDDAKAGVDFGANAAEVTKYLANVVANPNFINDDDKSGLANLQSGAVDVFFSGNWNAATVKEALGDNYGAAQLPTFKLNGTDAQMKSFAGSKAVAYNPNSKNPKVAAQFAAFLGSTEAQTKHWELRGIIPSDKTLTDLKGMAEEPSVKAQMDTIANTSILQPTISAMNGWWDPCKSFGDGLVNKEVTADNAAEKTQAWSDQLAQAITKAEEEASK